MEDRLPSPLQAWLALLPVLAALLLQLQLWELIQPYVWFLFYPAVFAGSWIGGFAAGLRATVLSIVIVLWFFVPPVHTLLKPEPKSWFPVIVFAGMGILFSLFHERLRRSERRFRDRELQLRQAAAVFEHTNEAIFVTDAKARIVSVNPAFTAITGFSLPDVKGATPAVQQSGRHDAGFYRRMWDELLNRGEWRGEVWNRRKDGTVYPGWENISAIRDETGGVSHYVAMLSDISTIKQAEEDLRRMAHQDALTGLPNRRFFAEALEGAIARAARHGHRVALLVLDPDRFKLVNDTLGHAAGDQLLQEVARRLKARLRAEDLVARLGGDEFTVVMEELSDDEDAAHLAGKLIEALAEPVVLEGREVAPSVSIGIALYPDDAQTVADLGRAADAAMYRAKERGRHTFEFFAPELTQIAMERLSIEHDLRRALACGEFELYFQPQVSLPDGRVAGMEALLRWNHPQRGLMPPEQFIPVAEECGLIEPIGDWVIRNACAQLRRWSDAGLMPATMAVNVSPAQILHDHLVETVTAALEESGLPGSALEIEVTESVLQSTERSAEVLGRLRALGVRIAIDDFGTGFSSLSLLKHLPIHALKIDLLFVRGLPQDKDSLAIVSAMLSMAHDLRLDVVAEGVETDAQRLCLQALGCRLVQGHLYGAAQPAREASRWVRSQGAVVPPDAAAA